MRSKTQRALAQYGIAVLASVCAAVLRHAISPFLSFHSPFVFGALAVMASAYWGGGAGPGLFATALCATLGMLIEHPDSPAGTVSGPDLERLVMFLVTGSVISLFSEGLHRSRRQMERLLEQSRRQGEELAIADRRKNEFLAMLGHELRNPISAVCNAAYVLDQLPPQDEHVPGLHAMLGRQAQHLSRLVDDLLDVARITQGKIELRMERVDLAAVLWQSLEVLQQRIAESGHEMSLDLPEGEIPVQGDRDRLEQIFVNLVNNAIKYTRPGGRISIHVERVEAPPKPDPRRRSRSAPPATNPPTHPLIHTPDRKTNTNREGRTNPPSDPNEGPIHPSSFILHPSNHTPAHPLIPTPAHPYVLVRVCDTGIGIGADLLPDVFELFIQSERALDRSEGGLGLGLTLVKRLVQLHGGTVEAQSEGVGRGSEFQVRLPLLASDGTPPAAPQRVPVQVAQRLAPAGIDSRPHNGHGAPPPRRESMHTVPSGDPAAGKLPRRVLVVDDNADTAEALSEVLELWGYEVLTTGSGKDALTRAPEFHPDAILVDIGLPGMNGYELATAIRQDARMAGATLLAVTGYGQDEDRRRSREAGFEAHLVKPVDLDQLRRLLADTPSRP